ncbi:long-chain fatty acid--CoA ligase [Pseudomonas aeruginosa]|nr:hypothetical protein Q067_02286 [Pseudomonas aeruginosa BL13]RTS98522.1 long-chain fatty acid--CoA ligase [Pseudomonas aeruginosa]
MLGTIMDVPLLLSRLIDHAAVHHATTEIVARQVNGSIVRENWAGLQKRSKRLAKALTANGYGLNDCLGSLAWNTVDHLELFYGVLGIGAGLHTLNPRISHDDLRHMAEKVGTKVVFIDSGTLALAEKLQPLVPHIERWIYMDEGEGLPQSSIPGLVTKAAFVEPFDSDFTWPQFDERQAATICFTSGTTGRPKGVAYSHRSLTLGAINMTMADMYGNYRPGALECVMPIAAVFHANAWMMPFSAPMNGHKLVLVGRAFDPESVIELIRSEGVTVAGAVPTIWQDLMQTLRRLDLQVPTLKTGLLAGTRPSLALCKEMNAFGIRVHQSWGMTEVPGAAKSTPPPGSLGCDPMYSDQLQYCRQGRIGFLTEVKLLDEQGEAQPFDGAHSGHLLVRGPIVAGGYLGDEGDKAEWLDTGDIATIYPDGTLEVVDRSKDVIKSGGEWISTLQLEAAALSHGALASAAAISIEHPRWQERPLLLCVLAQGKQVEAQELLQHMAATLPKWWLPDEVRFIEKLPLTPTGKVDKIALRREHAQRASQIVF